MARVYLGQTDLEMDSSDLGEAIANTLDDVLRDEGIELDELKELSRQADSFFLLDDRVDKLEDCIKQIKQILQDQDQFNKLVEELAKIVKNLENPPQKPSRWSRFQTWCASWFSGVNHGW